MNELLPGFEPSEADMIQMALDLPLEQKIEKAILFYQTYCDGAVIRFSGGKDSCVIKELMKEAGLDLPCVYSNVTIDPPELVRFLKQYHPDVAWRNPKMHLWRRLAEKMNPPTRRGRWCCEEYKERGDKDVLAVVGVRVAESKRRAKLWKQVVKMKNGQTLLAPICYWTDEDVWAYIKLRGIPYCELYDQGFDRLGCVGCPLSGNREKEFARWPRYRQGWYNAIEQAWRSALVTPNRNGEKRWIAGFSSPEEVWDWWMEDRKDDPDQCVFEDMMEQR